MTPDDIARIREYCEKAQTGPFTRERRLVEHGDHTYWDEGFLNGNGIWTNADCLENEELTLLCNARTDLPACVAEIERLREIEDDAKACPYKWKFACCGRWTNREDDACFACQQEPQTKLIRVLP